MLNRPPLATSALLLLKASPLSSTPLRSCSELRSKLHLSQSHSHLRSCRLTGISFGFTTASNSRHALAAASVEPLWRSLRLPTHPPR